jgi:hypothetical protein
MDEFELGRRYISEKGTKIVRNAEELYLADKIRIPYTKLGTLWQTFLHCSRYLYRQGRGQATVFDSYICEFIGSKSVRDLNWWIV